MVSAQETMTCIHVKPLVSNHVGTPEQDESVFYMSQLETLGIQDVTKDSRGFVGILHGFSLEKFNHISSNGFHIISMYSL